MDFLWSSKGHLILYTPYTRPCTPTCTLVCMFFFSRTWVPPWPGTHVGEIYSSARPLKSRPSTRSRIPFAQHHVLAHVITTTTTIVVVGVSFRPLQHPLSPFPPCPPAFARPAHAAAGNGSAYFIFKAGRIDNLQQRYVNAPSRTRATTAFFPMATMR